jgi:hypothetical protein
MQQFDRSRVADQMMQVSVEGYYNAIKPSFAGEDLLGDWMIRTQLKLAFVSNWCLSHTKYSFIKY